MVTIKDIAAQTGLSFRTVSRILSGKGAGHNEETRQRVVQAARQMGYRPHRSAKAMRQGRFQSVALLLSENSLAQSAWRTTARWHSGCANGTREQLDSGATARC
jgi:DNA-binding LacI/PurR family transcriptional regulator